MINVVKKRVDARELHKALDARKFFANWIKQKIQEADLQENIDFLPSKAKSTGGRPTIEYSLTLEAAKEICLLQQTEQGKKLRRYLMSLDDKVNKLELITVEQAAYAVKVIECLQYIANQKLALEIHRQQYMNEISNATYADFARYRADIVGWDRAKVEEAFNKWCLENKRHSKAKTINDRMNIMDHPEAIKQAVLDILFSQHEDPESVNLFANLVKKMAKELKSKPYRENENNLIDTRKEILPVGTIKLIN